jgi:hypothetical protein
VTSDIMRVLAEHAYLHGRAFAWWRWHKGRWAWRSFVPDVFWASR